MRKLTIVTFVLIMTTVISVAWAKDAGVNRIIHDGASPYFTVEGFNHTGKKLWLGASYKCKGGDWKDLKPKRIKEKNGPFRKNFTMGLCPQGYSTIRACLWEKKADNLMEGRIDCLDQ